MKGFVNQINIRNQNTSGIGIPKIAVESVKVSFKGLESDYNNYRMKSKAGTGDRAILLYSRDKMTELNSEGWKLKPGDIGENFLIDGINYDDLKKGSQYKIGSELLVEITEKCHPCGVLGNLDYIGKEKVNIFIKTLVNRRGWYAKVISEGSVKQGDPFIEKK